MKNCSTTVSPSLLSYFSNLFLTTQGIDLQFSHKNIVTILRKKKKMAAVHLQYHASLIQPVKYKKSHIFAVFVHVLSKLCTLGLKVLEHFCTIFKLSCVKNYG